MNEQSQETLVKYISAGVHLVTACKIAGIGKSTFDEWRKRGQKAKSGKYREFWLAIEYAEGRAEAGALGSLRKHWENSPTAVIEFLKRRFPENWSDRVEQRVAIQGKLDVEVERKRPDLSALTYDELEALEYLLSKSAGENPATVMQPDDATRIETEVLPKLLAGAPPVNGEDNGEDGRT